MPDYSSIFFFDLPNSYGTPVLLPFSARQYSLNLDIIIDVYFLIPLILGFVAIRVSPLYQRNIALAIAGIIVINVFSASSRRSRR